MTERWRPAPVRSFFSDKILVVGSVGMLSVLVCVESGPYRAWVKRRAAIQAPMIRPKPTRGPIIRTISAPPRSAAPVPPELILK